MKRKLLSIFLSLAMVLTMMPVFAMADSNNVSSGAGGGAGGGHHRWRTKLYSRSC